MFPILVFTKTYIYNRIMNFSYYNNKLICCKHELNHINTLKNLNVKTFLTSTYNCSFVGEIDFHTYRKFLINPTIKSIKELFSLKSIWLVFIDVIVSISLCKIQLSISNIIFIIISFYIYSTLFIFLSGTKDIVVHLQTLSLEDLGYKGIRQSYLSETERYKVEKNKNKLFFEDVKLKVVYTK